MVKFEDEIKRLLISGKRPREIKETLRGVSGSAISKIREKLGLPKFLKGRPERFENEKLPVLIRKLKALGLSYSQIGKAFGFSHQRAQQYILKRYGTVPNQIKKCSVCNKLVKRIHRHHSNYLTNHTVMMCNSCHRKLHTGGLF